jgi:hypothetical protein
MDTFDKCTDKEAYAFIEDKKSDQCFGVRSEDDKIDTTGTEIRDENGVINGIGLTYVSGSTPCAANPDEKYSLLVNVVCRTQSEDSELHFINATGDACHPVLNYESKKGCPVFTMDAFSQFIAKYYYLWGAALIALGVILAFFGNRFLNLVIFLTFFFAAFCILGSVFFYFFMDKVEKDWGKWLALAGIIVVSAGLGYGVLKLRKIAISCVAAWGGVLLGFVLTSTFIVSQQWLYYVILIGCGAVCFAVAYKTEHTVIIGATAFIGSYALVRGISLYLGGFPSESELHDQIQTGAVNWETFDKKFYIYLGGIVLLTIVSFFYQFKKERELRNSLHQLKRPIL